MARGEHFRRLQWMTSESRVFGLIRIDEILRKINFAALQHQQHVQPHRIDEFHLHAGIALRIAPQKFRKNALD